MNKKIKITAYVLFSFFSLNAMSENYVSIITKSKNAYTSDIIENNKDEIKVIERVRLPNGGYTLWSDGYIEQWGKKSVGSDSVVFHVPYTDEQTISFVIQEYSTGDQFGRHPRNLPTKNGVYDFYRSDLIGTWMSEGY